MRKYGGTLVFRTRDSHGPIEVVEDGRTRSLHFGTEPKQSSMDLHDTLRLELSYTRAMAASLLFVPEPDRVLLVGLGGGSLAKFLLHHTPCRIDAVELRDEVYRVAREQFGLREDPRLNVTIEDAAAFLGDLAREPQGYDLIFVDVYDAAGMADVVRRHVFIDAIRERLREGGMAAFNLWTEESDQLDALLLDLKEAFGSLLVLPVDGKANLIALCAHRSGLRWKLRQLTDRAGEFGQRYGLELPLFLKLLRKHNALLIRGLF